MPQKFETGDLVWICKSDDPMNRFEAIVLGSYDDLFGGFNHSNYTVFIKNKGHYAWFHEKQITLIKANQIKLLRQWRDEWEEDCKKADIIRHKMEEAK